MLEVLAFLGTTQKVLHWAVFCLPTKERKKEKMEPILIVRLASGGEVLATNVTRFFLAAIAHFGIGVEEVVVIG